MGPARRAIDALAVAVPPVHTGLDPLRDYVRTMRMRPRDRDVQASEASHARAVLIWSGAALVIVVLAIASSTDSLDVWRTPEVSEQRPPSTSALDDGVAPVIREPLGSGVNVVGLVIVLLVALLALLLLSSNLRQSPFTELVRKRLGWGRLSMARQDPLPEVAVHDLDAELGDARNALLDGDARNGIVACWMRLERGALDAGLPRWASETAEEYSRRVVTLTSVDPAPLDELAELYREARFSGHQLSERHRGRASVALGRIGDGLGVDATEAP